MISASLRFGGFDARSWTNLISLFSPGFASQLEDEPMLTEATDPEADVEAVKRRGTLVIVIDGDERVLKSFYTDGRGTGEIEYGGRDDVKRLAREHRAERCVVVREGAVEEFAERVAMRLERGDDYISQWLCVARVVRELHDAGLVRVWPEPWSNVPIPNAPTVRRAIDLVLPDDHAAVVVLWEGSQIWTAAALRRRAGEVDQIAGPDLVARWTGPLGGDWNRDFRLVSSAVSQHLAPVHVGIYGDVTTVRNLLRSGEPGVWAKAVAVRDLVVHPMPRYIGMALAADAIRAAAKRSSEFTGGLDATAALAPLVRYVRTRVAAVASVSAVLGFDPLKALSQSLRRDSAPEAISSDDTLRSNPQ